MTQGHSFTFHGMQIIAMPTRALWIPAARTLCVSDLHFGKSGRIARRSGAFLPPYETQDTLTRLAEDIANTAPQSVICLGDSFDDLDAATELMPAATNTIAQLQAGRDWIWIEGNHDAGPVSLGGSHRAQYAVGPITFRHIATAQSAEISGHYHPKFGLRGAGPARPCFIYDNDRLIMPAYGTYTGGLSCAAPVIRDQFGPDAIAVLTGKNAIPLPVTKNPA